MNINEILERHNQEDLTYNVRAKQAIKEIVKETLRMAADDARLEINTAPLGEIYGYVIDNSQNFIQSKKFSVRLLRRGIRFPVHHI